MVRIPLILTIVGTALLGMIVHSVSFGYFATEEVSKAEGRLSLYRSSVEAELERFAHLPRILARDTFVIDAAKGGGTGPLNARLESFAARAGLDAIYLMGPDGFTIAASNYALPSSFVGQNYAFRPYFKQAIEGDQGRFYAIGSTTGEPGYFIANAVRDRGGAILGVIAIKKSLSELEQSWVASGEQVMLVNQDGVVMLASDSAWRYRTLQALDAAKKDEIRRARQFAGKPLEPLDWTPNEGARASIGGVVRLHLVASTLPHGWALHYFASDDRAVARSWLATAVVVLAAGSLLILFQVQRARRIGRALQRSEMEEAQLRESNAKLAVEISERKTAEQRLKQAQSELERASRLAALGELSASVTHELGQPIAAMRNHIAAAEFGPAGITPLTTHIGGLVDRMEGITRQLKFFATPEREPFEVFDLREAMAAALALVAPNIEALGCVVDRAPGETPASVRGSRLRIEQVMTNLLRNAVDAMEGVAAPRLSVRIGSEGDQVYFEVADTGHGLGAATLNELQEPFVTTRESGHGMGLGLAISDNIIKDHEGRMSARNRAEGGAVFRVTLPRVSQKESHGA
ncbi:sensor histidine kinase [Shimia aestuarii]|uniref:histidine kinase n=1 Tax=Shimia aestuarii TaxID=254406 RepID=A0A1I4KJJ3_9RHOB|nr:ATP-binding protein [Shimia aestuarii]SFL78696.1 two-component system, NtrC family, C4-dicarboxylate transport sensor histidine kinase DctB [Shimia aestuarii]